MTIAVPTPYQLLKDNNYHFPTLLAGLEYQRYCPFCQSQLELTSDANIEYHNQSMKYGPKTLICGNRSDEVITIDLQTQAVTITKSIRDIYETSHNYPISYQNINANSRNILEIGCIDNECSSYGFKLVLDIYSDYKLRTTLNGEWIEADGLGFFNQYGESYFYYWDMKKGFQTMSKSTKLPFIPINLNNPQETILRAKRLITFL